MKNENELIRTRFAPSPTGDLHIGGARTVLFNYLLAKKNHGRFILRIEDTDTKRNQEEFVNSLHEDLLWLGLKPDESIFQGGNYGPYRQIQRLEIYQQYINKLIKEKKVYYCFCSVEELTQEKEAYIKRERKINYQYSRKCLGLQEQEIQTLLQKNISYVLRFKVNQEKSYSFHDLVRGEIIFQGKDIEDFVLFRQNGIPNYNFACVIDDYLMKISHVLRGEEHLSNTGKQLVLYEALGWTSPLFGHLSIILNKEKKKLSKRDKETSQFQLIKQLRETGYLPTAIVNYLLFLGWHPNTTKEIFSIEEVAQEFDLKNLNKRGAIYSLEKINWYNHYYIQQLKSSEFEEYSWEVLKKIHNLNENKKEWCKQISYLFREQLNYFQELILLTNYFFQRPNKQSNIDRDEIFWLNEFKTELNKLGKWEEEEIKIALKISVSNIQTSKKSFFLLLRKMFTGQEKGPELAKIIFLLGNSEVKERLNNF